MFTIDPVLGEYLDRVLMEKRSSFEKKLDALEDAIGATRPIQKERLTTFFTELREKLENAPEDC